MKKKPPSIKSKSTPTHPAVSAPPQLSHVGPAGGAMMVDVSLKPVTRRIATAQAYVSISAELLAAIGQNTLKKGDLIATARIAGITAAKRTAELIPLCHSLPLDYVEVTIMQSPAGEHVSRPRLVITATACASARTGVEMEALTAAAVAALTVLDMGKAIDKNITISDLRVIEKQGGSSGHWRLSSAVPAA